MKAMKAWWRAFGVEWTKMKHTSIPWLIVLMPACVAGLVVLSWSVHPAAMKAAPIPAAAWASLEDRMLGTWSMLMLPVFVALLSALATGLEHGNAQWKHLLALPLPHSAHYLAKWSSMMALMAATYAWLLALVLLAGRILMVTAPARGIAGWPAWPALCVPIAISLGSSMLIVALQTWLALRWKGFGIPVAVGMLATMTGVLLFGSKWARYFPWTLPEQPFVNGGQFAGLALAIGLVGAGVVGALGLVDFLRREDL